MTMPATGNVRLKDVARLVPDQLPSTTPPDFDFEYLDISSVGTGVLRRRPQRMTLSEAPSRARQLVRDGDVIVSTVRTYLKSVLPITARTAKCVVSTGFAVLRPLRGTQSRWLGYLLQSPQFTDEVVRRSDGIAYPAVRADRLMSVPVSVPTLGDQVAAVRLLDHVQVRIARATEAKRHLAALLDERRRAASQAIVTNGLGASVKKKQSGNQWLGDVPAHWEVRPAKWFYREVNERSQHGDEQLMSVSHLTGVTPRATKNVTMFMAASYAGHKLCRPGDLVINTMWAWMGALGVAWDTGIVSPAYGVYRPLPDSPLQPVYADLLLRTQPYIDEYTCRSTGIRSSRLRLYPDRFLTVPIVCPPVEEQIEIVHRVSEATRDLDATIAATLREIQLLQEYRTRLLADVVIGRRDVRAEAVDLPDVDPDELDAVLSAASADDDVDENDQE